MRWPRRPRLPQQTNGQNPNAQNPNNPNLPPDFGQDPNLPPDFGQDPNLPSGTHFSTKHWVSDISITGAQSSPLSVVMHTD